MNQLIPILASRASGPLSSYRFLEFCAAEFRNPDTRRAYARGDGERNATRRDREARQSARAQGDLARARPLFERALAIREKALGPKHPDMAQSLNNLALLLHDRG